MRHLRRHQRLFLSGFGGNHTMDEKLIRMLIQYKDEFDRAPDNLSLVACTALLDLYLGRLAACGFDESTAMGILSAIFGLRDRRDPSGRSTKQVHMAAALARRTEQANAKVPAAA
jgi:hypothetical protein